jgi:hypothetical protein
VKVFCGGFLEKHFPIYRNMLAISLTFSVFFGYPGLADSSPLTSKEVVIQGIKLLAATKIKYWLELDRPNLLQVNDESQQEIFAVELQWIF